MYKSLTPAEREKFLQQTNIHMHVEDSIINNATFFIKVRNGTVYEENVLHGKIIKYNDFLVVRDFNPVSYSNIVNYVALLEVVTFESIKRLMSFSKTYFHKDLRIYSCDTTVIDQLYEHGATIERVAGSGISEVLARLILK